MLTRRAFLLAAAPAVLTARAALTPRERIDRVLRGQEPDRQPFTCWYHFRLEALPGEHHARATLDFHRRLHTDLVKVMSDFPYPRPAGPWYQLKPEENPYPEQVRALRLIREGLRGSAHFIETIFNPWNVAEKLSSSEEVLRLMRERPQVLLDALEVIARSEARHARRAVETGASGVFLAIANAQSGILTSQEYARFSEPFDRIVLEAVSDAPLNTLHIHGDKPYLERFYQGWPAQVLHHSAFATGVGLAEVRQHFSGVILGGLDETAFRKLTTDDIAGQWRRAREAAGLRFILAPGCSVPDDTSDEELLRVPRALQILS